MKLLPAKCIGTLVSLLMTSFAPGAAIIFDNFNVDEGHFTREPTFSGSTTNVLTTSTADRVTDEFPFEPGQEKLVINQANPGATRVRFLSGTGTPANNVAFTTTSGIDGWIGFYLRTDTAGWTTQLVLETTAETNGGVPKDVIADGQWHLYEWNLDDETGGPDGWGSVPGIFNGDADFEDGSYTIDSIILRGPDVPTSTLYLDFVAKNDAGSVADLVPEPSAFSMTAVGLIGFVRRRSI